MARSDMMQHYMMKKREYEGCILFYRLGDFYELFFEDAIKVSNELGLTLTSKACGDGEKAPMCGVPFKSAETYVAKLLQRGYKVAVCEQLTEAGAKKGLVERDVTQIITPGTIMEKGLLQDNSNNFIASIYAKSERSGAIAYADISTGEFFVCNCENNLVNELNTILSQTGPKELLGNKECLKLNAKVNCIEQDFVPKIEEGQFFDYNFEKAKEILSEKIKDFSSENEAVVKACCNLLCYAEFNQKQLPIQISKINVIERKNYVEMDAVARKNLDIIQNSHDGRRVYSLLDILSQNACSMGGRRISQVVNEPLCNLNKIMLRQDAITEFYNNNELTSNLRNLLKEMSDIQRLSSKLASINFCPSDAVQLAKGLKIIPKIRLLLKDVKSRLLVSTIMNLKDFTTEVEMIENSIDDKNISNTFQTPGTIKRGLNQELDELMDLKNGADKSIREIEMRERISTGIKNLRVGYTSVFGFYIEVTNSQKHLVPLNYVRKQTTTNAERYITPELKQLEEKRLTSEERILRIEKGIFEDIKQHLKEKIKILLLAGEAIADLDFLSTFAFIALKNNYVKPIITEKNVLKIVDGRHPVVEQTSKKLFVPNNTNLDDTENKIMLITGPNMSGKSTYMRQVAIIALMAQMGGYVPAKQAEIGLIDKVFTRIGASDDIAFGQSTFMVEMVEVANILKNASSRSLIVLDEVGRGTSTLDGMAIAQAILEYLANDVNAKVMFSTHYHELIALEDKFESIKNYSVCVREIGKTIEFLHKIVRGGANRSYGIEVAELAGVPSIVTDKARVILKEIENSPINAINNNLQQKTAENLTLGERQALKILKETDINELTPLLCMDLLERLQKGLEIKDE